MLLAIPFCAVVVAAFALGVYGIAHVRLYRFVLLVGAIAWIRPLIALILAAWRGYSPAWFEEQDLNDEEVAALRDRRAPQE